MEKKNFFETCRTGKTKIVLEKIRNISFLAAVLVIAFAGIYFILGVDLALEYDHWVAFELNKNKADQFLVVSKSKSLCLIISVLLMLGSAALSALSEIDKGKVWLVYLLKGLSIVLVILFLVVIATFEGHYLTSSFFTDATNAEAVSKLQVIKTLSIVFSCVGIATVVTNVVSNVLLGIEE